MTDRGLVELIDLKGEDRERAVPTLVESFEGIYRWHAKRTLRRVSTVRAVQIDGRIAGVAMLERLTEDLRYVYYLAVGRGFRRRGLGGLLLDDALSRFEREGARIVYAAAEEDNLNSLALFRARGFRRVEREELASREGGLAAWGLRSRMMLVTGEVLLGKELRPRSRADPRPEAPPRPSSE